MKDCINGKSHNYQVRYSTTVQYTTGVIPYKITWAPALHRAHPLSVRHFQNPNVILALELKTIDQALCNNHDFDLEY